MERLIEYLLESAGAATLLMVKEAILKTVGWFTRARGREEVVVTSGSRAIIFAR